MHYDNKTTEWRALVMRQIATSTGRTLDPAPLRSFINAYVAEAKEGGAPPEQVICEVKDITSLTIRTYVRADERQRLMDDVFQWCLDAYFGPSIVRRSDDKLSPPPRRSSR